MYWLLCNMLVGDIETVLVFMELLSNGEVTIDIIFEKNGNMYFRFLWEP